MNFDNQPIEEYFSEEDINENKLISILCYFGIFLLIPFLVKPQSKYVKFHSNQGLILIIAGIINSIILIIPLIGWIVGFVGSIFLFVCFVLGIINALTGKAKRLPLIGKYNLIKY